MKLQFTRGKVGVCVIGGGRGGNSGFKREFGDSY